VRKVVKAAVEKALTRSGVSNLMARRHSTDRLILAYHNVVPVGERLWGERSLHIAESTFRAHLEVLQAVSTIVPLDELLDEEGRPTGGPRVSITFDDGYRGALTIGARVLAEYDLPATFFLTPGLSPEEGFWWDRLAEQSGGTLPVGVRNHCLHELDGRHDQVVAWASSNGLPSDPAPPLARAATREEVLGVSSRGRSLGCHTWTHPNLARLSSSDRRNEFRRCREWIAALTGTEPRVTSYPYGLQSVEVHDDARAAGHRYGLCISGGFLSKDGPVNDLAVPRLNVPAGLSPAGLRLRLAGIGLAS
jgi:peptidoglycan/xylan/chitin deacetylase (PgdA/CDA1 family)